MKHTTKSNEDYLETILKLETNGSVKSVLIANALDVSKAAVSVAMKELIERNLIKKEIYGDIQLTPQGRKIAKGIQEKHTLIKKLLVAIGVSEATAEIECCKIEHILSEETVKCLKNIEKKID
ncbi:MAG: metal-dependent transcriptional regulator [Clostridia bacterium]